MRTSRSTSPTCGALPRFGEFDLLWAVNDAMNYLLDVEELRSALVGMRGQPCPRGRDVFDVNTPAAYRGFFAEELVVESGDRRLIWRGLASAEGTTSGSIFEARFDGEGAGVQAHPQAAPFRRSRDPQGRGDGGT